MISNSSKDETQPQLYVTCESLGDVLKLDVTQKMDRWPGRFALYVKDVQKTGRRVKHWWGGCEGGPSNSPEVRATINDPKFPNEKMVILGYVHHTSEMDSGNCAGPYITVTAIESN